MFGLLKKVNQGEMYDSRTFSLKVLNVKTMINLIRLEKEVASPIAQMGSSW